MSEKDNFSDLVGNRSGQSASSDFTNNRPGSDELDSLDSLDFYDSTDFSNHPSSISSPINDNDDAVDELIETAEISSRPRPTHENFSIAGPDDELEFVARAEHVAHTEHAPHHAHESHESFSDTHVNHEAPDDREDYETHEDYESREVSTHSRPGSDFVSRSPRYSHRATDSAIRPSGTTSRSFGHAPANMISDFQPVSKKTISTASIHSSGRKSKPEFADDIISISAFETTTTEESIPEHDYDNHSINESKTSSGDEPKILSMKPVTESHDKKPRDEKSKTTKPRKKSHHFAVGLFCIIIALVVAGVGIAVAIKLINENKSQPSQGSTDTPNIPIVTDDNTTLSFLQLENNKQNLIYSPLSIRSGLALLDAGADGTTKTQISKVLGSTEVPQYQGIDGELSLANGVFIRDTYRDSILDSYIDTVTDNQNAQLIFGDLTADLMNQWAKDNTLGLIDNLGVTPTDETKVVLANALAIKMDWEYQFDSALTRKNDFYAANNKKINATTMSKTFAAQDVYYATNEDETIVSLPLSSKSTANLEFAAIMPKADLASYIKDLTPVELQKTLDNLASASDVSGGVEVNIPKFKFDYELEFKKDLENLGIVNAFSVGTANFSKLSTSRLYVNDAVHKANIDFSESGIEAAAVTTFSLDSKAIITEDDSLVRLTFDHPFLFVIRDRANDAVWFTGTVYTPSTD
ncbi:hypothetical protein IKE87_02115 [Candidatus Saccharibacteria bacterium]|nr:hypothetical protein [Candidatus Saccharibacteria bacterium]